MAYVTVDTDIDLVEVFDGAHESEKCELRDRVCNYFGIPNYDDHSNLIALVVEHLGDRADGLEARELIKRTLEELEYRLKMRDFS